MKSNYFLILIATTTTTQISSTELLFGGSALAQKLHTALWLYRLSQQTPSIDAAGQAALTNDHAQLRKFIALGGNVNESIMASRLLIIALDRGHITGADILFTHGAYINAKAKNGDTALVRSVRNSEEITCRWLLEHKADVNVTNDKFETPLMIAAAAGNKTMVDLLLQHNARTSVAVHAIQKKEEDKNKPVSASKPAAQVARENNYFDIAAQLSDHTKSELGNPALAHFIKHAAAYTLQHHSQTKS